MRSANSMPYNFKFIHDTRVVNDDEPATLFCSYKHIFFSQFVKIKEGHFGKGGLIKCFFLASVLLCLESLVSYFPLRAGKQFDENEGFIKLLLRKEMSA